MSMPAIPASFITLIRIRLSFERNLADPFLVVLIAGTAEDHRHRKSDKKDTVGELGGGNKPEIVFLSLFELLLYPTSQTLLGSGEFLELFVVFL